MICYARKKYLLKVLAKKKFFTERRQVKSTGNDSFLKVQLGAVIERCSTRIVIGETYSEPNQTSKMEHFVKIIKPLAVFAKHFNLDVWQGSKYTSGYHQNFRKIKEQYPRLNLVIVTILDFHCTKNEIFH